MTETNNREIEYFVWKRHKVAQHINFLDNCRNNDIFSKFCQIPQHTSKRLLLQPQNSLRIQQRIFDSACNTHIYNFTHYEHKLNSLYQIVSKNNQNASKLFSIFKSKIQKSEFLNDRIRHQKFENLLKTKSQTFYVPTVQIHNLSDITLPENIHKILLKGIHQPVGGRTNRNAILTQFEGFFDSWKNYALSLNLDIYKITQIRSQLYLEFTKLVKCTTLNDSDNLKKFLDNNPEVLICPSDKSKNVNVIDRKLYIKKLDQVFNPEKFQRLKISPINTDLDKVRKLIRDFKPYLSNLEEFKMRPIENLKRGYGIIKNHKNN